MEVSALTDPNNDLAEQIKAIKTEREFTSRWEILLMYHEIGEILVSHRDTLELSSLSSLTEISERNLYRSMQFYEKYPDLALLPEGKNASWHRIVNNYLPEKTDTPPHEHHFELWYICSCGERKHELPE